MKNRIKAAIAAAGIAALAAFCFVQTNNQTEDLFEKNVEALADRELCPGEKDNCDDGGERCLYYYNHANYNIEGKTTKR